MTKPEHIIDEICSCEFCTKIDCIFGDPLLNDWEKRFIDSVARQGWQKEYSDKQKRVISKIFTKQKYKYTTMRNVEAPDKTNGPA